jgi:hypothetical protein
MMSMCGLCDMGVVISDLVKLHESFTESIDLISVDCNSSVMCHGRARVVNELTVGRGDDVVK